MMISEENEFEERFSFLMDCGAMNDKNWPSNEVKYRTKKFLKLWQHKQKSMVYISPVTYV